MTDGPSRVALVTGGSRGIGRAISEALLKNGWTVFSCGLNERTLAASEAEFAGRYPNRFRAHRADIGNQNEVDALVEWVSDEAGRLDCLVNNAGLGIFKPVDQISGEEWRSVIRTNLNGAFYMIRAAAPLLKQAGNAWVINIASIASKNPFPTGAAYNASKFGLLGLSDAAMLDLRHDGIRVTSILPGSVYTEFGSGPSGEEWKLSAEDVARAVMDVLAYPDRALPSRIELRPTRPPRG